MVAFWEIQEGMQYLLEQKHASLLLSMYGLENIKRISWSQKIPDELSSFPMRDWYVWLHNQKYSCI